MPWQRPCWRSYAIEAQAPVITENGMVNVWLDANLLKQGRAVLKDKDGR